ncbi:MAG: FkbM family methyltransferase [Thermoplasmata archaeon]
MERYVGTGDSADGGQGELRNRPVKAQEANPGDRATAPASAPPNAATLRTRLSWFARDLNQRATGAENPQVLWKVRHFGGRSLLRFPGGWNVPVDRQNYATVRSLVDLVAFGATLAPLDRAGPGRWGVSFEPPLIETPSRIRFTLDSLNPLIFAETFISDIHFPGSDLRGRNVVDGGAFVGDTALYYASLGARVYSYEPDPGNLAKFRSNLALNPELGGRITASGSAIGTDGTVWFQPSAVGGGSVYGALRAPTATPSVSLRTIVDRIDGPPFLLKLDCKGVEFDVVQQPALREFAAVELEYAVDNRPGHTVAELIDGLRNAGFSQIRRFKHNWEFFDYDSHGILHAQR